MSYRDQARRALESSDARHNQNQFIHRIRHHHAALQGIETVTELIALLWDVNEDKDRKDAVLLALVKEHQRGGGPAFSILATAMFPALDRLYRSRLHRHRDHDDFWGRIVSAFVDALERYPVSRRPAKVAANIEGDTMAALRRSALREMREAEAAESLSHDLAVFGLELAHADLGGEPSARASDLTPSGAEAEQVDPAELKAAEAALGPYFEATALSEGDRFLILGVHLYERTLGDLAKELGISRDAAKKRHLRAMAKLRDSRPPDADNDDD